MSKLHVLPAIAVITACLAATWVAQRTPVADHISTFSSLPEGDELRMIFTSEGCFHNESYELKFRRSPGLTAEVTQLGRKWSDELNDYITTERIGLGELALSETDEAGLNRLLAFYRTGAPGGCTTVDRISVKQYHNGRISAWEQFLDASCSRYTEEGLDIMDLVARLRKHL